MLAFAAKNLWQVVSSKLCFETTTVADQEAFTHLGQLTLTRRPLCGIGSVGQQPGYIGSPMTPSTIVATGRVVASNGRSGC